MSLTIRIDDKGALAGLRRGRAQINTAARRGLREAVKAETLPIARELAPRKSGRFAASIRAGAISRGAFIQSRDPRAGLLEYGGTRRDTIRPHAGHRALSIPGVGARGAVHTPRHYKGRHAMSIAADRTAGAVANTAAEYVAAELERALGAAR